MGITCIEITSNAQTSEDTYILVVCTYLLHAHTHTHIHTHTHAHLHTCSCILKLLNYFLLWYTEAITRMLEDLEDKRGLALDWLQLNFALVKKQKKE